MIKIDNLGLIGQHSPDVADYLDFGDSCMKTSIAVIGGLASPHLLDLFITRDNLIVRHPTDEKWSDPKLTSRDQAVCLMAALALCREYKSFPKYKWFINKDIMFMPDVSWFQRVARGERGHSHSGSVMMNLSILYAAKFDSSHELNQLFCMALVLGDSFVRKLCKAHPHWQGNLIFYWGGWRDQPEIGLAFINRIKGCL